MMKTLNPAGAAYLSSTSYGVRRGGCAVPGKTFGDRLKELREQANLTQPELAERAGMNRFGVAKLEQGQREPTWATVRLLAKALGVNCSAFEIDEEDTSPTKPPKRGRPKKEK